MRSNLAFVMTALLVGSYGEPAFAAASTTGDIVVVPRFGVFEFVIHARVQHFRTLIDEGLADGSLTKTEAIIARSQVNHLEQSLSDAKADGNVSKEERIQIMHEADQVEASIHELRHNDLGKVAP